MNLTQFEDQDLILSKKWNTTIINTVIKITINIILILGNSIVLTYILTSPRKLIKPNILILSLTLSDFLAGIYSGPMAFFMAVFDVSQLYCYSFMVYATLLARASSFCIMIIAIDRYVKLKYTMFHRVNWSSLRDRLKLVSLVWIPAIILTLLHHLSVSSSGRFLKGCYYRESYSMFEQFEPTISLVTSNIVSLVMYIKILIFLNCGSDDSVDLRRHVGQYNPRRNSEIKKQFKPALVLGSVVILNFVFVALPPITFTFTLLSDMNGDHTPSESYVEMVTWVFLMSSVVNPIIFAKMNKPFQKYLKSLFCCSDCFSASASIATGVAVIELTPISGSSKQNATHV